MQGAEMVIGRAYAHRHSRTLSDAMTKVTLVDKVGRKGKIKIRWDEGDHPGLEEYVATRDIVCAWGERKKVERDEERTLRLAQHAERVADRVLGEAVSAVLCSSGENGAWCEAEGLVMDEGELRRIFDRAGIEQEPADLHFLGFRDRRGDVHLPLDAAVELARTFAAAEPSTVTGYIGDEQVPRLRPGAGARPRTRATVGRSRTGSRRLAPGDQPSARAGHASRVRAPSRRRRASGHPVGTGTSGAVICQAG